MPLLVLQTLAELLDIPLKAFVLTPTHHHVNCVLGPLDTTKQVSQAQSKQASKKHARMLKEQEERPHYRQILGNKLNNLIHNAGLS